MTTGSHASSRRSFLKLGAAALAGAAAARLLDGSARPAIAADAPAAGGDEYGGLTLGIQSYTLRDRSFEKALEAMQNDLKVHAVELFPQHVAAPLTPPKVKELLEKYGVTALSYGVIGFSKNADANRKLFDLAKTYGMTNLSCDPDPDSFDSLEKLCEEYKVTVAIHPHGPGNRWGKVAQLEKAFAGRSTNIGLCADTGHLIRAGEDPVKVLQQFKDRVHALHLKDFKHVGEGDKWEDVPAGSATLDVDGVVKFLLAERPKAPVFIEYEGGNPVESTQKSLARVREAVKKAKA